MRVRADGQEARTRYTLVETAPRISHVRLELETGRKHQIRAHLEAMGWPVLGDPRYGDAAARRLATDLGVSRLCLHAGLLRLTHPRSAEALEFSAPFPGELQAVLGRARA
jgi:23S rRNA-/tRNA-specific pseudouridylate synthase